MLSLGEPGRTAYDVNFAVFGFPVRISAFFWLAAVVFGQGTAARGIPVLLMWVGAMLLSILVHELGHTFAFRRCGISSHIVLYHFGGLAIPDGHRVAWSSSTQREDPQTSIFISIAGPALEIFSAVALIFAINLAGYAAPTDALMQRFLPAQTGAPIPNDLVSYFVGFYCYVSIYWGLLNLLPIYPLDGGKIARSLMQLFGNPAVAVPYSLMLSVGVAAIIALYGFSNGETYLAIMFGILGYSSFQQLQMYQGPRQW